MSLTNTKNFEVLHRNGNKETVVVKENLSIRELYQFCRYTGAEDTFKIVALCAGKSEEWIDTLDLDSYLELVAFCVQQNFPQAMELMTRDQNVAVSMAPYLAKSRLAMQAINSEEMQRIIETSQNMKAGKDGASSSPAPVSSESPAAITSGSSTSPQAALPSSSPPPSA